MILKKILTALLITLCSFSMASADTLGFRVGGGIWQPDAEGKFRQGSGSNIDLDSNLKLKDGEDQNYVYAVLEHPLPLIPNFKVANTTLSFNGTGDSPTSFTYGGTTFTTNLTSKLVLDHSDVTAYYQFLDNWLNFDLGLTARSFAGELTVTNGTDTYTSNIDQTVPMLYGALGISMPFLSGLYAGIEVNYIEYDGSMIKDHIAKISYTTSYLVGIEVGVRTFTIELDNVNNNYSEMEFTGSYASLYIHF